jgi:hypothetical protein
MSYVSELAELRRRWAARPAEPYAEWALPSPDETAGTAGAETTRRRLWAEGEVAFGWVYLAGKSLWEPNAGPGPALLLTSADPRMERDAGLLELTAAAIWEVRRATAVAPGLGPLRRWANEEAPGFGRTRVPSVFSEGRVVWRTALTVHPATLPGGHLVHNLVPVVQAPRLEFPGLRVLRGDEWPGALAARWIAAATPG